MNKVFKRITSVLFALVLLVSAVGASTQVAHATNPILTFNNFGITYTNGWAAPEIDNHSCVQVGDGLKCHWVVGRNGGTGHQGMALQINFNDTRSGSQSYDYHIDSYAVGNFWYTDPVMRILGSGSPAYTFSVAGQQAPSTGIGVSMEYGSTTSLNRYSSLYWTGKEGQTNLWDVTVYIWPSSTSPIVAYIPANIYIDSTESNSGNNNTVWTTRIQNDYLPEVNYLLAKGSDKRLIFNGLTVANTPLDVFHYQSESPCNANWGGNGQVKILFSSNGGGALFPNYGWTNGIDCDGFGTIVINTESIGLGIWDWIPPSQQQATDEANGELGCTSRCRMYWDTVTTIGHEFVHTQGGFAEEGYSYSSYADPIGNPDISWHMDTPNDKWWSGTVYGGNYKHPGLLNDPMAEFSRAISNYYNTFNSMQDIRDNVAFSELAIKYLNTNAFRSQVHIGFSPEIFAFVCQNLLVPNLQNIVITQHDVNENPVSGITIKAWLWTTEQSVIPSIPDGQSTGLFFQGDTDANGQVTIPMTGGVDFVCPNVHAFKKAFIIKSYDSSGNQYGEPEIVDAFNVQLSAFDGHLTEFDLTMTSKYGVMGFNPTAQSGKILETNQGSGQGGNPVAGIWQVGDTTDKKGIRNILQFNTANLPDNAIIDSAILWMMVDGATSTGNIVGFGPSGNNTAIDVRIGNPCVGTCGLQNSDWQAGNMTYVGPLGPICTSSPCGWSTTYYTGLGFTYGLSNISKTNKTEFRLQYQTTTDADGASDKASFDNTTYIPVLAVYYHVP